MGSDSPENLPHVVFKFRNDAVSIPVRLRRYSPPHARFFRSKIYELLNFGLVRRNYTSRWAYSPHIVPNDVSEGFRFTFDLSPVNSQTKPQVWPMQNVNETVSDLKVSTLYSIMDFRHGYWQLLIHPDSKEFQSLTAPDGFYSPTRVLQGHTNATGHFQAIIPGFCTPLREIVFLGLYDIFLQSSSVDELFSVLRKFFFSIETLD